jgi:hypothetical protein
MKPCSASSIARILLVCSLFAAGCDKQPTQPKPEPETAVDPGNSEALSRVVVIAGATQVTGDLPATSSAAGAPMLTGTFPLASTSRGGTAIIPLTFVPGTRGIAAYLVKIPGSSTHFRVPSPAPAAPGQFILPIGIPARVLEGEFPVLYCVVDSAGRVGNVLGTVVRVTAPSACATTMQAGGEGTTATVHALGSRAGTVRIAYDTYWVPDRIDVYYRGRWVTGMGPDPGGWPKLDDCSNVGPGYRGEVGELSFPYVPVGGDQNILVVVSGCLNGGTAWEYSVGCPGSSAPALSGNDARVMEGGGRR